jgi:hypothetical protein
MRGRKHPLEIFRQNGDSFLTLREGQEAPRRSKSPARNEEARDEARRNDDGRGREAARPEREAPRESDEKGAAAGPPGKAPKRAPILARSGGAQRRPAASRRLVGRSVVALLGLVLLGGLAYAVKLRFFSGSGAPSDRGLTLQRDESIRSQWPDHALPKKAEETSPGGGGSAGVEAAAAAKGQKEPAAKAPARGPEKKREYWIVAASVKLSEQERSKTLPELRKELFKNEEQKLHRSLDAEIERLGFRVQTVATNQKAGEFVLRVGCAAGADDANLKSLLAKVTRLGGSFKNAMIRDYPPAATK